MPYYYEIKSHEKYAFLYPDNLFTIFLLNKRAE